MLRGSFLAVAALFVLTAAAVNLTRPRALGRSDLASCPTSIAGFTGRDTEIRQAVLEELDPTEMIVREYTGDHLYDTVWLVIEYFENARYGAHDPEVCYISQGWEILDEPSMMLSRPDGIAPLEARVFRVRRPGGDRLVAYWWFIDGDQAMTDQRRFLDTMAIQGILKGSSYGTFVRVSTRAWPGDDEARLRLGTFAQEVLDVLPSLYDDVGAQTPEGEDPRG